MASATLHSKQKEMARRAKAQAKRLRKQERHAAKRKADNTGVPEHSGKES